MIKDEVEGKTLYSHTSPPANVEAARVRLRELETANGIIESELLLLHPEKDFYSREDYDSWRHDAIRAHGYKNAERNYLLCWLQKEGSEGYHWSPMSSLRAMLHADGPSKCVAAE